MATQVMTPSRAAGTAGQVSSYRPPRSGRKVGERIVSSRLQCSRHELDAAREEQRNRLVVALLPLVKRVAQQIRGHLPLSVELDDLVSTGALGLVDAVRKFDPHRHVKLERYAQYRIRGAILDGLRDVDHASRDLRRKNKKAEQTYTRLEAKLGRQPGDEEMAEALGISLARWQRTLQDLSAVGAAWLPPRGTDGFIALVDPETLPSSGGASPFDLCYRREQRDVVTRTLGQLPERERRVLLLYYSENRTMRQIGEQWGIDESRVSQLHAAGLARLRLRVRSLLRHPHSVASRPAG